MTQHVMWFDSGEAGAPVLNNAAGSLIGVLDACLVTGFNTKTITALVVASGVATATCNGHGFSGKYSQDILIAGATPALLNGRFQPTVTGANSFTFPAPAVADGAATGTITARRAPLGWIKQFSGTSLAMYKRSDVTATANMLRVSDAAGTSARAFMVETATGISTFTGQAPTNGQLPGGQFWNKGSNDSDAKQWVLVGDSKRLFLWANPNNTIYPAPTLTDERPALMGFGDAISFKSGDAHHCFINGGTLDYVNSSQSGNSAILSAGVGAASSPSLCFSRRATQLGSSMQSNLTGFANVSSGGLNMPGFPSIVDGGMVLMPGLLATEDQASQNYPYRAAMPGLLQVLARHPLGHMSIVDPVVNLPGRKVIMLSIDLAGGDGQLAVDITGPWG